MAGEDTKNTLNRDVNGFLPHHSSGFVGSSDSVRGLLTIPKDYRKKKNEDGKTNSIYIYNKGN